MDVTPRQIVYDTLEFKNADHRTARDLWTLPWAWNRYEAELRGIAEEFPPDFGSVSIKLARPTIDRGDMYEVGEATDLWGCRFVNVQRGVVGEASGRWLPPTTGRMRTTYTCPRNC